MQSEPLKADSPKRKRRWFQFSLRSLLIFTLACAIPLGWLGKKIERKRKERKAVEALVKTGFTISKHPPNDDPRVAPPPDRKPGPDWLRMLLGEDFFSDVYGASFCCRSISDDELANLKELPELRFVALVQTKVTVAGLASIQGLTHLRSLRLDQTKLGDAGLPNLKGLMELRTLDLEYVNVTDDALVNVEGMAGLKYLSLASTRIGDAGLVHLKGCTGLESLSLRRTEITDAGLIHLEGLSNLLELDVSLTNVTSAGEKRLRKVLPNCSIIGNFYHIPD